MDPDVFETGRRSPSLAPGSEFSSSGYSEGGISFTPEPSASRRNSPFPLAMSFADSSHAWSPESAFNGKLDFHDYGRGQFSMRPPIIQPAMPSRGTSSSSPNASLPIISRQLTHITGLVQAIEDSVKSIRDDHALLMERLDEVTRHTASGDSRNNVVLPSLERQDYPNSRLWSKDEWLKFRHTLRAKSVQNEEDKRFLHALGFITDKHGRPVSLSRLADIRQSAHGTFRIMEKSKTIGLPETWARNVDEDQRDMFIGELEKKYPELRLCNDHWKANSLAIECLSHFKRKSSRSSSTQPVKRKLDADEKNDLGNSDSEDNVHTTLSQRVPSKNPIPQAKRLKHATKHQATPAIDNPLIDINFDDEPTTAAAGPVTSAPATTHNPARPQPTPVAAARTFKLATAAHNPKLANSKSESTNTKAASDKQLPVPTTDGLSAGSVISDVLEETRVTPQTMPETQRAVVETIDDSMPHGARTGRSTQSTGDAVATSEQEVPSVPQTSPMVAAVPLPALAPTGPDALPDSTVGSAVPASEGSIHTTETRVPSRAQSRGKPDKVFMVKENAPLTARNLAGVRWKKEHPEGLEKEFMAYWKLVSENAKKMLEKEAKDLKKAGKTLGMDVTASVYTALRQGQDE